MNMSYILYNHKTSPLSKLDKQMVEAVPAGGNWKDIPESIPSKRLDQIRISGGRTTYYGRLTWDNPSYTISTYFNRPGNGCYMHPDDQSSQTPQHRLISFREAARLQSFPDGFRFYGTKTSMYKQIGNAVPPLLAYSMAKSFNADTAIDLFCGCGGLSYGFELFGTNVISGVDIEKHYIETWKNNHNGTSILGDLTQQNIKDKIYESIEKATGGKTVDIIIGGPPCQGFSTAGWRNEEDSRNLLWNHYLEVVNHIKPKYFLIENVMGLLSATQKGAKVIDTMKKEFAELGYSIKYQKLHAEDYGVPQKRRRIFIIGQHKDTKNCIVFPHKVVGTPLTVSDAIRNLPALKENDGYDEVVIGNYIADNPYEKWLSGEFTLSELMAHFRI
jgi:DNA (cytosine-5)-methyltransferase 1